MVGDNLALPGPLPQLALCCLDQWSREGERERKKEREVEKETEVGRERSFFVCCIRITQIIFFIFPAHAPGATAPCLGTHCHAQGSMCTVFSEEHYIHSTPPGRAHSKHALTTKYRQINNKKKYHHNPAGQRNRCAFCTGKRCSPLPFVPKGLKKC